MSLRVHFLFVALGLSFLTSTALPILLPVRAAPLAGTRILSRADDPAGAAAGFKKQNALTAQALNVKFATLKSTDTCTDGIQACVEGGFGQCVGSKWLITACGGGNLQCLALPLVNSAGTSITCDTPIDAAARFTAAGVTGGVDGKGGNTPSASLSFASKVPTSTAGVPVSSSSDLSSTVTHTSFVTITSVPLPTATVSTDAGSLSDLSSTMTDTLYTTVTPGAYSTAMATDTANSSSVPSSSASAPVSAGTPAASVPAEGTHVEIATIRVIPRHFARQLFTTLSAPATLTAATPASTQGVPGIPTITLIDTPAPTALPSSVIGAVGASESSVVTSAIGSASSAVVLAGASTMDCVTVTQTIVSTQFITVTVSGSVASSTASASGSASAIFPTVLSSTATPDSATLFPFPTSVVVPSGTVVVPSASASVIDSSASATVLFPSVSTNALPSGAAFPSGSASIDVLPSSSTSAGPRFTFVTAASPAPTPAPSPATGAGNTFPTDPAAFSSMLTATI